MNLKMDTEVVKSPHFLCKSCSDQKIACSLTKSSHSCQLAVEFSSVLQGVYRGICRIELRKRQKR